MSRSEGHTFINAARSPYGPSDRDLIGMAHAAGVRRLLGGCPAHRPTPLPPLPAAAAACGLASVHIKGEWARMGLHSFKALGGAYAVVKLVTAAAEAALGRAVAPEELSSADVRAVAGTMTFACASAGNHGLSVAAGARMAGARAVVYLSEAVAEGFARRLGDAGAEVRRAGADYEASLAHAAAEAERHGWTPVSDCSSPGPPETALEVMRGYTILLEEAAEALEAVGGPASHVFIQAGVGGLAAAAAGYLRDRWGEDFRLIVVQPAGSPCLLDSIRAGRVLTISRRGTALGRLDCAAPSPLAFDMLLRLADAVTTISDAEAMAAADRLGAEGAPVSACGAAGAAGLFSLCGDADGRHALNLSADARVLLVGTEAA